MTKHEGPSHADRDTDPAVKWLDKPEKHDYPAAASYLSLIAGPKAVNRAVKALREADTVSFKAKDLLRAAGLPLLPADDPDVAKELGRVRAGTALSPCLIIRGNNKAGTAARIADGYHRVCASYHLSEDTVVPARIAGF
ncbi:hypothetical protein GCM10007170_41120 [Arthrobacter liuii]|uniref:ParB-like nuclease domain-containing protein n=2 Tax=Arthrobacter liuii TaxID=1476996 RepID=A0ABQ2B152_9MICC|nr:hypothetical protein [Arthrobacter liuii]GGI01513.1 hypothetical protein GCM10007170_41120 [Arthrobacter liuii]